jgi:uncharacterized membrane protein YfcA
MPEEAKSDASTRHPSPLSSEYHKARKQLMLWAGILFVWELVGIDLEKAKEAGGNAGAIIGAIKSPQAVPWALLILVAYFAFKLRIEWRQCSDARRQVREAKQDYYSACLVAVAAWVLYFGQAVSHIQFANAVQGSDKVSSALAGGALGTGCGIAAGLLREWYTHHRQKKQYGHIGWSLVTFLLLAIPFLIQYRSRSLHWSIAVIGSMVTFLGIFLSDYIGRDIASWRTSSQAESNLPKE